jgi:ubiquinone/menaquinone biosynthesis C-methylase UbiE
MTEAEINRTVFSRVVKEYTGGKLETAELAALAEVLPVIGKPPKVLDLGVGAGRTTIPLKNLGGTYVGLDYSSKMVAECRRIHPQADIRSGDCRSMPEFAAGTFDLVLFSFNGLDAINHRDRLQTLSEIRRVLRSGGAFIFSSHNRGAAVAPPWDKRSEGEELPLGRYLVSIVRHLLLRRKQRWEVEYAILNDRAHDYALLHYYITPPAQVRQLLSMGFAKATVFDLRGSKIEWRAQQPSDPWLYYVCYRESEQPQSAKE